MIDGRLRPVDRRDRPPAETTPGRPPWEAATVRVQVADVQIFFEVYGQQWVLDGDRMWRRPVMLALHGGPGLDATGVRWALAPLAGMAQLVVPDQRGHGRSDRGAPATWNLARWAADVRELSEVLGLEAPVVLGKSFGGFVAQRYAAAHPQHPAGLILMATSPRFPSQDEIVTRFRDIGGDHAAEVMRRELQTPSEQSAAEWARVCRPLLSRRADPDPQWARAQAARITSTEVSQHFDHGEARTLDLRPALRDVRCPTLVIQGQHDPLIPISLAQEIVAAIPDGLGRLAVIPDAAHNVETDNPAATFDVIRAFVASLPPPQPARSGRQGG
jgi:pimeloyl-ACP methyl ester carboxylesterase